MQGPLAGERLQLLLRARTLAATQNAQSEPEDHPPHAQVEANIFARIVRVIKSYLGGFVESLEDPELMLDRITAEMQEDAARMRQVGCAWGGASGPLGAPRTGRAANQEPASGPPAGLGAPPRPPRR